MDTIVTLEDLSESSSLATAILEMLVDERVPPARAACALAVVLGRVCARFGVDIATARVVLEETYAQAREAGA